LPRSTTLSNRFVSCCVPILTLLILLFVSTLNAQVPTTQISTDTFTNTTSQHETEVEPASYAFASTIVSVFQVGRFSDGGSSAIGFATSTDAGATWTHGNLPGITKIEGTGTYDRASDTSVIYNQKFKLWLAETLGLSESGGVHGAAVLVSSSKDGITWNNPSTVSIVESGGYYDKPWIGCDNHLASPFYGNCYVEWDDFSLGDLIQMSTSKDGGATWSAKVQAGGGFGNGGLPLVQPNGTIIVPVDDQFLSSTQAFKSTNGGSSWSAPVRISTINEHGVSGGMRALPELAAQMDAAGKVYVVWADCRFRSGCSSNDIVMSTSTDGTTWSTPVRIPIDPVSSTVDHFTPGLVIDRATAGGTAHLALTFNFFPKASCVNCNLGVGYVTSRDGGATWSHETVLGKGISPSWLPSTTSGQMAGDYQTVTLIGGKAHGVTPLAQAPVGSTLNEAMFTNTMGLSDVADGPQFSSANDKPVPNAHSDHPPRTTPYHEDGR
jgi:hypothetical protein